ncbi:MAG: hypothetical protein WCC11_00430, partial [Gammaproteobacteria bacterium]
MRGHSETGRISTSPGRVRRHPAVALTSYDRYTYVNDNPLSLSDPSGYWSEAQIGGFISDIGPFLQAIPVCAYWCTAVAAAAGGNFTEAAVAAAFQRMFNDEKALRNIRGTSVTDAETVKLLDASGLATDKETLFVVLKNGTVITASNCISNECSLALDKSAQVAFVAHTHIASTSSDPETNWVETEMRELPGPEDTEPLVQLGAPNYFRTPSGAIRVLEQIGGTYVVRTVQGTNFIYAVADRTPRVYPWMNEPGGGMVGGMEVVKAGH